MMSLYLKALEGERGILPRKQHLLPALGNNIKCGNSLIGYDIIDPSLSNLSKGGTQGGFFALDKDAKDRINPFDWNSKTAGFGEILESGGFDAVIGNPPYVRQELLGDFKVYFQQHYEVYHGTADLYAYFIEKGVSLLKKDGLFSYIVANKWMRANYGESLRRWMKKQRIEEITDFGDLPVFETATTYPCILRIKQGSAANKFSATQVKTLDFDNLADYVQENSHTVNKTALRDEGWALVDEQSQALLDKLQNVGKPLGEYVNGNIFYGIKTALHDAFVIDAETRRKLIKKDRRSAELIKPFLLGRDVKRYEITAKDEYLILIPKGWTRDKSGSSRGAWNWFKETYSAVAGHLQPFADKAENRQDKGEYWWELRACDYYSEFEKPKIMWPEIAGSARFAYDNTGYYANNKVFIIPDGSKYLLGLLNSTLLRFFIENNCTDLQGNSYNFSGIFVSRAPIRTIDFNNPSCPSDQFMIPAF